MQNLKRALGGLLFACSVAAASLALLFFGMRTFYRAAYPVKYAETVEAQAAESQLDQSLIYAVIRTESGFRPTARSSVDARGLMQITPDTFHWIRYRLGETGPADPDTLDSPEENIRYGAATLALLLERFGGPREALAAYHAGWGSVSRWLTDDRYSANGETLEEIPFGDTDAYVEKVLRTAEIYRKLYP